MHLVTKFRNIVAIVIIVSIVFKPRHSIAWSRNSNAQSNFCLSTQIILGNFTQPNFMFPSSSKTEEVGIVFLIQSNQNYFLNSNSTTELPFVNRHAQENCFIFNIYLPNPIHSFYSNDNEVAIALIRIIRNSSFGFDEGNVHFLIHLKKQSPGKESLLKLFADGGMYSFEFKKLVGDDESYEKNELSTSARITFVIKSDLDATVLKPYCYQCPEGTRLKQRLELPDEFSLNKIGSFVLFQTLSDLHKSLELYEEKKAYVFSPTPGEVDHLHDPQCMQQNAGVGCFSSHKKLNATATKLNMSLVALRRLERPKAAGLYFCLLCNPRHYYADISHPPSLMHNDIFKKFNAIYCHYRHGHFDKPEWLMLCRPFDGYIWIGILITCFAVGALKQDPIYSLDVFAGIVNQPVQKPWTFGMTSIFLVLLVLTNGYLGIVTRDLTKPIQERRIETIEELLEGGNYKITVDSPAMAEVFRIQFLEPVKPKLKLTSANYQIIPNMRVDEWFNNLLNTFQMLAKYHGAFGLPDMHDLKPLLRDGFRIQYGNASCTSVAESFPVKLQWMLRLNYAGRAFSVLERLQMAGLDQFWEKAQKDRQFARMMSQTMDTKTQQHTFGENRPEALVLDSSPKIVFIYYSGLIAVAVLSFCCEFWWWNKKNKVYVIFPPGDPVLVKKAGLITERVPVMVKD